MTGPLIRRREATMACRSQLTPRTMALGDPDEEAYPVMRRTLPRVLAVVVAIAAICPLFATESNGCAGGSVHNKSTRLIRSSRTLELSHH